MTYAQLFKTSKKANRYVLDEKNCLPEAHGGLYFCNRRFVPPFDVNAHLSAWAVVRTTHQPHQKDTTGHQNGPIGAYKKPRCGSSGFVFFNKNKLPERLLDAAYRWTYRTVDLELDHI